jgi:hypothetical protein
MAQGLEIKLGNKPDLVTSSLECGKPKVQLQIFQTKGDGFCGFYAYSNLLRRSKDNEIIILHDSGYGVTPQKLYISGDKVIDENAVPLGHSFASIG